MKKIICGIGTTMAVTGILLATTSMYPKIKLQNNVSYKAEVIKKIEVADLGIRDIRTSRSSYETRKSKEVSTKNEVKEEKMETAQKTEGQESKKTENIKKQESLNKKIENSESKNKQDTTINKNTTKSTTSNNSTTKKASSNKSKTKSTSSTKKSTSSSKKTTNTKKTISKKSVNISINMDLSVRTGLSRDEFIELISKLKYDTSGFFRKNAGTIYDLCKKYSINEIFFCGLISAESGWNIASNHRRTHNYISLMSRGKLIQYGSVYEGLEVAAQKLHYNYLTKGGCFYHGKTLSGVKVCFCPSGSWVNLVYGRMKQIV